MYLELLATFVCLIFLLLWWIDNSSFRRTIDKIPGPKPIPLLGNIKQVSAMGTRFIPMLKDNANRYYNEGIFRLWAGPRPLIFCYKPETVEILLNSSRHLKKGYTYEFLLPWLGTGLLTSDGEKWKHRRRLLTPAFHFKILTSFCLVFNEQAKILADRLRDVADGQTIDIFPYITACTLDVICDTAMGCHVGSQTTPKSPYVESVVAMSEISIQRMIKFWLFPDIIFYNLPIGRQYKKHLKVLHDFTLRVIARKEKEFSEAIKVNGSSLTADLKKEGDSFMESKKRFALLDLLLYSKIVEQVDLSEDDIREEVDTFMFEGHDTTASGISWTLYLLGNHPDVQKRVQEELDSIFGDSDRDITMDDIQKLKYLECVIKESLRLFPPVPNYGRTITETCKIGGYDLPAGVTVVINTYALHRRSEIFSDPESFNPDRWNQEELTSDRHPYCYIPFSAGFRNCIGQKFAMNEEKVVLSTVLRHFSVTSIQKSSDLKLLGDLILRPEDGLFLKIEKRNVEEFSKHS